MKRPRFFHGLLVLLIIGGAALAIACAWAPQEVGKAWRSIQALLEPEKAPETDTQPAVNSAAAVELASARKDNSATRPQNPGAPLRDSSSTKATVSENAAAAKQVGSSVADPPAAAVAEPSAAAALAAALFEFPADEAGRLLAERLSPPARVPLAPTPFVREPRRRSPGMPEDLAPHLARLPPAVTPPAPLVVKAEQRSPQRGQPAIDRPPLAAEADPARPQRPTWPAAPLAYSSSVKPEAVPALRYVGLPPADAVAPQDDPTADSSRAVILASTSIPPPTPLPPLRLTIPDPFEHAAVVRLANPPADRDPPEPSFQRPQPPPLPMPEAPKEKKK